MYTREDLKKSLAEVKEKIETTGDYRRSVFGN